MNQSNSATQQRLRYDYLFDGENRIIRRGLNPAVETRVQLKLDNTTLDLFPRFSSQERDLARVAAAIHCMDRISPKNEENQHGIFRTLHPFRDLNVELAVENPVSWQKVAGEVEDLLWFMTEDCWTLSFSALQPQRNPSHQRSENSIEVALSSGGLDSIAGLWVRHREQPIRFATVSVYGDGARKRQWTQIHEVMRSKLGVNAENHYHEHRASEDRNPSSNSGGKLPRLQAERSRGFRYWGIGAAIAHSLGSNRVTAYETGVGALNLPFNEAQVGSQNTRAMHPGTLVRMEKILGRVLETPMKLDLPFFFKTKGELCEDASPSMEVLAKITMSCDGGETRKSDPTMHCGCCTSCLFRRAALFYALGKGDPTNYLLQRKNASYFRDAFTNQVHQLLRACESYQSLLELDPNISYVEDYWKVRGIHIEKIKEDTRMLFERYAKQAQRFLTEVPPP